MFDPKTNKFPYPIDTSDHYLKVTKDDGTIFDENYPYIDKTLSFKFKRFWVRVVLFFIVFPFQMIRMGFRVKGKKNLRKNKILIKNGVVSVCNHVHMFDYIGIMNAIFPRIPKHLSWQKNVSGPSGGLVRLVGGIPIPENNMRGLFTMMKDTIDFVKDGGWLHIYAEGSMWEYYAPIRPFKDGVGYFAYKADRPVIPMAYAYRPVGWIRKHIFKQIAKFTLNIGEPIFIDKSLPKDEAIKKITIEAHEAVCKLAGYKEGENIYQPLYNKETSKRIDYYTSEYGVGYKGSW
jgi:1-acyl-sn-glycerol-3-phosphate acyltransferase